VFPEDKIRYKKIWGDLKYPLEKIDKETIFVNEAGLYSMILGTRKNNEKARKFKQWITHDVLPSIRKTGKYEYKPKMYYRQNKILHIQNETELNYSTTTFMKEWNMKGKRIINYISTLGEMQDTDSKRIDAYRKGYEKGQPDYIITNSNHKYDGMVIELKSPTGNGQLSEAQKYMLDKYKDENYKVLITNDFGEFVSEITKYMQTVRYKCKYCRLRFRTHKSRKNHYKYFHKINVK
jgi:hypothetical protein